MTTTTGMEYTDLVENRAKQCCPQEHRDNQGKYTVRTRRRVFHDLQPPINRRASVEAVGYVSKSVLVQCTGGDDQCDNNQQRCDDLGKVKGMRDHQGKRGGQGDEHTRQGKAAHGATERAVIAFKPALRDGQS